MGEGRMVDRRCPEDGAALVSDGEHDWCSLVGCTWEAFAPIERIGPPTDEPRIEVDHIEGLDVTITVLPAPSSS